MPMQRYKPEQVVTMLRQIEVAVANGKATPQACKEAGITVDVLPLAQGIWRVEGGAGQADEGTGKGEQSAEAAGGGAVSGEAGFKGRGGGKLALSGDVVRWSVRGSNTVCRNGTPAGCLGKDAERNDTNRSRDRMRRN